MEFKSLLESASTNSQRRYKCMYCTKSYERAKLVNHIDKVHEDMIPEGYTAARLVFNMINKKDHGTCIICGKESPWNEEKGRYDRICTNPECKKKYIKMTEERLQKARGITKQQMLNDPEFQEKMLSNRCISGKYKFQDGTYKTYTGTYEKKFLEFMDVFLHVNPADIYAPGPVIEYEYEGEKHKWITDFYYEPYNLVFDIKDGGENPNNRSMVHYRAKQIEKEKAIKKLNKYNYIRLTDNNFEQLVLLMMELKELYLDSNKDMDHIIRVNESSLLMENESIKDNGDLYLLRYNIDKEAMMENTISEFPYVLQEAKSGNKHPLFIVLSYTFTTFGKLTKAITHADYSHAAIAFEPSLHEMFSFNGDNKVNTNGGFSIEDIDEYTKFSDKSYILINTVFVNDSQYKAIKGYVEDYKKNIKNTKYSFANIFRILLNKPINDEGSNQMVCSEFVYSIFKYINQDFLNKSTNLVTPQDLADVKNKRIYKIYEGLIKNYKLNKIEKKLSKLYNSAKVLGEQFILEAAKTKRMYHLSQSNLDNKTIQPNIPSNFFTKNGYEENKTPRVCFAPSISKCLRALTQKCEDMVLFVHVPDGKYDVYTPTLKEVPDQNLTGEMWITKPVKLKCIGCVKVIKDKGEPGLKYYYGEDNKYSAELYDWEYKWISKITEDNAATTAMVGTTTMYSNNMQNNVFDKDYVDEMSAKERNALKDSDFGIPSKRKYPLDTEAHARSAIKFFNYCDKEDEKELASNIIKVMKRFNITDIKVSDKNRFSKYYNSKKEFALCNESMTQIFIHNEDGLLVQESLDNFIKYARDIHMYKVYQTDSNINALMESSIDNMITEEVDCLANKLINIRDSIGATITESIDNIVIEPVPILSLNESIEDTNVRYYRDLNGVYIKNINNGFRSKSFESENEISDLLIRQISESVL